MAEYDILGTDLKIIDDEMDGKDLTVVVSVRGKQDIDSVSGVDNRSRYSPSSQTTALSHNWRRAGLAKACMS